MSSEFKPKYRDLIGAGVGGAVLGGVTGYATGETVGVIGANKKALEVNKRYHDFQRKARGVGVHIPIETRAQFREAKKMALHNHIAKRRQAGAAIGALVGGALTARGEYIRQKSEHEKAEKKRNR